MKNQEHVVAENVVFSSIEKKFALGLLLFWLTYVIGLLVMLPPYWALMDDHSHLLSVEHFKEAGFFNWIQEFLKTDGSMFRPVYAAFIYLFYGTWHAFPSKVAYLALYFLNLGIFFAWGSAFACSNDSPESDKPAKKDRWMWSCLFVILSFHFIRNNNLFYFASLQERLVILFLAPVIHLALDLSRKGLKTFDIFLRIVLIYFFLALMALSKAPAVSFLFLVSVWLAVLGMSGGGRRKVIFWSAAIALLSASIAFALFLFSIRSGYSSGYRFEMIVRELTDKGSKFYKIVAFSFLTLGLVILGWMRRTPRDPAVLAQQLFWPLGMLAYTVLMLPWQGFLNYYLIIPVGMCWVGSKLLVFKESVFWLNKWKPLPYVFGFITVLALTSITPMWKFYQKAIHHHGTGKVVEYLQSRMEENPNSLTIRMAENCEEGSAALGNFLGIPGKITMAASADPFYQTPPVSGEVKLLVTNRECPLFPDVFLPRKQVFRYSEWIIYEQSG